MSGKATLEYRRGVLRTFEELIKGDDKAQADSYFIRSVFDDMLREYKARIEPDRALLIQTAAAIVHTVGNPTDAIAVARQLIAEVDR